MIATVCLALGSKRKAFEFWEKAFQGRSPGLAYFLAARLANGGFAFPIRASHRREFRHSQLLFCLGVKDEENFYLNCKLVSIFSNVGRNGEKSFSGAMK